MIWSSPPYPGLDSEVVGQLIQDIMGAHIHIPGHSVKQSRTVQACDDRPGLTKGDVSDVRPMKMVRRGVERCSPCCLSKTPVSNRAITQDGCCVCIDNRSRTLSGTSHQNQDR